MENPVSKHLLMQFEWMLNWVNEPLQTLEGEDFNQSAFDGGNNGVWLFGHLIISDDDFSLFMGKGDLLYPEYIELFGTGTKPDPSKKYPSVSELKEAWEKVCDKNMKIYESLTDNELNEKHARIHEKGMDFVKTKGEVASVWQFHQAYHAGQISVLAAKIKNKKLNKTV